MSFSRATLVTAMTVALVVACSTYGAEDGGGGSSDGGGSSSTSSSGGGSSSGSTSSSGGSSSGSGQDGGAGVDAADSGFSEACPPCSGTCVPSGCSGAGPNVACNKPYDVTTSGTITVFACPEGLTVPLPNQVACGNGGPKHGALLRLGPAPDQWNVKVQGTNPFAVGGDCNAITSGSCSSSEVNRNFAPNITIVVGTSSTDIQTCVVLSVTLTQT